MITYIDSYTPADGNSRETRRSETSKSLDQAIDLMALLLEFKERQVVLAHMARMQADEFRLRIEEVGRNTKALFAWEFRCTKMEEFRALLEAAYYGMPADDTELRVRIRSVLETSGVELGDIMDYPWMARGASATVIHALCNGVRDREDIGACRDAGIRSYHDYKDVFGMWKDQDEQSLASMLREYELV